jgi:hypothetical protein
VGAVLGIHSAGSGFDALRGKRVPAGVGLKGGANTGAGIELDLPPIVAYGFEDRAIFRLSGACETRGKLSRGGSVLRLGSWLTNMAPGAATLCLLSPPSESLSLSSCRRRLRRM